MNCSVLDYSLVLMITFCVSVVLGIGVIMFGFAFPKIVNDYISYRHYRDFEDYLINKEIKLIEEMMNRPQKGGSKKTRHKRK